MSGGQSHKNIREAQDESSTLDSNIRGYMTLKVFKYIQREGHSQHHIPITHISNYQDFARLVSLGRFLFLFSELF